MFLTDYLFVEFHKVDFELAKLRSLRRSKTLCMCIHCGVVIH